MNKTTHSLAKESHLAQDLAAVAAIKAQMMQLLHELELRVAGHKIEKPGGWRHHPAEWAAQNLPQR